MPVFRTAHNKHTFVFDYPDLMRLTGLSYAALAQHVSRGKVDPANLESVVLYLAKHAKPELQVAILTAALRHDSGESKASKRK